MLFADIRARDAVVIPMLTETDVVNAVRRHLESRGWTVEARYPTQIGDDIVATRGSEELHIEAKGEGSEKEHTKRYGYPFTRDQVKSHVAVAFYRAVKMRTESVRAAMAFPDNKHHREMVATVESAIRDLELLVFWVSSVSSVTRSP